MVSDDFSFEGIDLPLANPNEEIEIVSENKLRLLFDNSKFQFCSQDKKDKGIDLTYEIKKSGKHTGFRFIIQLKASENLTPNRDGSFSLAIDTSNINYLLNSSYPSYYILYVSKDQTFYYKSTSEILLDLDLKKTNWRDQKSHTIRFKDCLIPKGPNEMYNSAIKSGIVHSRLRQKSLLISASMQPTDNIVISHDLKITDDNSIRQEIEQNGMQLINQGNWKHIIDTHKKATNNTDGSALYNLILGISYFYVGQFGRALDFIKKSNKLIQELNSYLQGYVKYFNILIKYSIGIIDETSYNKKINEIENNELIESVTRIEKIRNNYIRSLNDDPDSHGKFIDQINSIINGINASDSLKLAAQCELLYYDGYNDNIMYISEIAKLKSFEEMGVPNFHGRILISNKYKLINTERASQFQKLTTFALSQKNNFMYYVATVNYVRVMYQFEVYYRALNKYIDYPGRIDEAISKHEICQILISQIRHAINFFNKISHQENQLVSSAVLFELLHYTDDKHSAEKLISEIQDIAENHDMQEYQNKLSALKNKGTVHELFQSQILDHIRAEQ